MSRRLGGRRAATAIACVAVGLTIAALVLRHTRRDPFSSEPTAVPEGAPVARKPSLPPVPDSLSGEAAARHPAEPIAPAGPASRDADETIEFSGTVVLGTDRGERVPPGTIVPGARVSLDVAGSGEEIAATTSGRDGSFALRGTFRGGTPPATVDLRASREGLLSWIDSRVRFHAPGKAPFRPGIVLSLHRAPDELLGRVIDARTAGPVPGVRIRCAFLNLGTTDEDGAFRIETPRVLIPIDLTFEPREHLPVYLQYGGPQHPPNGRLVVAVARVEDLPSVEGRVFGPDGRPAADAIVRVGDPRPPRPSPMTPLAEAAFGHRRFAMRGTGRADETRTDADGRYGLLLPYPGGWSIRALHGRRTEDRSVDAVEGRPSVCDFTLDGGVTLFVGSVESEPDGSPVPQAEVLAVVPWATWFGAEVPEIFAADARAHFEWGPVPRKPARFRVRAPRHGTRYLTVSPSDDERTPFVVGLEAEVRVRGRVADEAGMAPEGARVIAFVPPIDYLSETHAANDGSFELGLLPGRTTVTLAIDGKGSAGRFSKKVEVALGSPGSLVDLGTLVVRDR